MMYNIKSEVPMFPPSRVNYLNLLYTLTDWFLPHNIFLNSADIIKYINTTPYSQF